MVVQADTAMGTAAAPAVRALAAELLPQTAQLAREMNDHLFAMMAELRERDDGELRAETLASCEVNIAQVLRLQKLGAGTDALVLPLEAAGWARSLVRRGITLATLLRRIGSGMRGCGTAGRSSCTNGSPTVRSSWPPSSAARRSCSPIST